MDATKSQSWACVSPAAELEREEKRRASCSILSNMSPTFTDITNHVPDHNNIKTSCGSTSKLPYTTTPICRSSVVLSEDEAEDVNNTSTITLVTPSNVEDQDTKNLPLLGPSSPNVSLPPSLLMSPLLPVLFFEDEETEMPSDSGYSNQHSSNTPEFKSKNTDISEILEEENEIISEDLMRKLSDLCPETTPKLSTTKRKPHHRNEFRTPNNMNKHQMQCDHRYAMSHTGGGRACFCVLTENNNQATGGSATLEQVCPRLDPWGFEQQEGEMSTSIPDIHIRGDGTQQLPDQESSPPHSEGILIDRPTVQLPSSSRLRFPLTLSAVDERPPTSGNNVRVSNASSSCSGSPVHSSSDDHHTTEIEQQRPVKPKDQMSTMSLNGCSLCNVVLESATNEILVSSSQFDAETSGPAFSKCCLPGTNGDSGAKANILLNVEPVLVDVIQAGSVMNLPRDEERLVHPSQMIRELLTYRYTESCVFVSIQGGLDCGYELDVDDIMEVFVRYGPVDAIDLLPPTNSSAFVSFLYEADSRQAVENLNRKQLQGVPGRLSIVPLSSLLRILSNECCYAAPTKCMSAAESNGVSLMITHDDDDEDDRDNVKSHFNATSSNNGLSYCQCTATSHNMMAACYSSVPSEQQQQQPDAYYKPDAHMKHGASWDNFMGGENLGGHVPAQVINNSGWMPQNHHSPPDNCGWGQSDSLAPRGQHHHHHHGVDRSERGSTSQGDFGHMTTPSSCSSSSASSSSGSSSCSSSSENFEPAAVVRTSSSHHHHHHHGMSQGELAGSASSFGVNNLLESLSTAAYYQYYMDNSNAVESGFARSGDDNDVPNSTSSCNGNPTTTSTSCSSSSSSSYENNAQTATEVLDNNNPPSLIAHFASMEEKSQQHGCLAFAHKAFTTDVSHFNHHHPTTSASSHLLRPICGESKTLHHQYHHAGDMEFSSSTHHMRTPFQSLKSDSSRDVCWSGTSAPGRRLQHMISDNSVNYSTCYNPSSTELTDMGWAYREEESNNTTTLTSTTSSSATVASTEELPPLTRQQQQPQAVACHELQTEPSQLLFHNNNNNISIHLHQQVKTSNNTVSSSSLNLQLVQQKNNINNNPTEEIDHAAAPGSTITRSLSQSAVAQTAPETPTNYKPAQHIAEDTCNNNATSPTTRSKLTSRESDGHNNNSQAASPLSEFVSKMSNGQSSASTMASPSESKTPTASLKIAESAPIASATDSSTTTIIQPSLSSCKNDPSNSSSSSSSLSTTPYNNNNNNNSSIRKWTVRYDIQIDPREAFQVTRRIIGSKGANMKKIYNMTNSKLRLRGQGSGYLEGVQRVEADDPLHLCISSCNSTEYMQSKRLVEDLLTKIYGDYDTWRTKEMNLCPAKLQIKYKEILLPCKSSVSSDGIKNSSSIDGALNSGNGNNMHKSARSNVSSSSCGGTSFKETRHLSGKSNNSAVHMNKQSSRKRL